MSDQAKIIEALEKDNRREIYQADHPADEYWITYGGGGPFRREIVIEMFRSGLLKRKYEDGESYYLAV
jgi:hypothetical protein